MPNTRPRFFFRRADLLLLLATWGPVMVRAEAPASRPAASSAERPVSILSRDVSLEYRLADAGADTNVELWYTRDRGASWQCSGPDEDRQSPLLFRAPAEGLYGLSLVVRQGDHPPRGPAHFEVPQRWVLIDSTPPLLQWNGVDRGEDFVTRRVLHLRWTAFDDHFGQRPMALLYQTSGAADWKSVEREFANLGRYDWAVPRALNEPVLLKLVARDVAGNLTERTWGPTALEPAVERPVVLAASTRPAAVSTRPADTAETVVSLAARQRAEQLYQQGTQYLRSGEYAVVAERFREALESDPDHLAARNDLAGIYYLQRDYNKALDLYQSVLKRDGNYVAALRGAALVNVAQKQYAPARQALQKLIAINGKDGEAWLDLGDVLYMMDSKTEAISHWSRAASVDPAAESIIQKARRRLESYGSGAQNAAR